MKKENVLQEKTYAFVIKIVKAFQFLTQEK